MVLLPHRFLLLGALAASTPPFGRGWSRPEGSTPSDACFLRARIFSLRSTVGSPPFVVPAGDGRGLLSLFEAVFCQYSRYSQTQVVGVSYAGLVANVQNNVGWLD